MQNFLKKRAQRILYSAKPEICMDIGAWAAEQKLPLKELYPPIIEEVKAYVVSDAMAEGEFCKHRQVLERPQTLVAIEKAFIRNDVGIVELPDGLIVYEGNWWLPYLQGHPAYQRRFLFKNRHLKGNYYSLLCLWASEYYHWFHDVLPRLENALPYLPDDTRFLINEKPRDYQLESLKAYGITNARLELQPIRFRTRVERLWFATPVGHTSLGSGKMVGCVARRLKRHYLGNCADLQPRRIYVSRQKALSRRVVNENELRPLLKEQGFDFIVLEDLIWPEQVRLFSTAEAIMGPHGAGLMNMMFAQKNTSIYEISAQIKTVPCYLVLARQMAFQFQRLQALLEGDDTTADMQLPSEIFESAVNLCPSH